MFDLSRLDFLAPFEPLFNGALTEEHFVDSFKDVIQIEQAEGFEDLGNKYVFKHDFGKDAKKSDIQINLDDESEIKVSYRHETKNSVSSFKFTETLPPASIPETLEATFDDGVLVISVKKEEKTINQSERRKAIQIK